MFSTTWLPRWVKHEVVWQVLLAGLVLFSASYVSDSLLYRLGIPGAATVLNDAALAVVGGAVLFSYLLIVRQRQYLARARERAILLAKMNHQLRDALSLMRWAVVLDDRGERLRRFDEAAGSIDRALFELLPMLPDAETPPYSISLLDD